MDIGHRMKELRIQYGLTQQELADRAELTKGFISQLERNQNSPSIGTLLDIIQCLGTTPAEFFTDEEPEQIVFKQEDYFEKTDEEKHCCIEWVVQTQDYFEKIDEAGNSIQWTVPTAQKNQMEPVRLTLHAGGRSEVYQPHEGEDFGYVITGNVRIHYAGQNQTVHAGESFYFKAGKKHYLENTGSKDAVIIWVTTPPNF